MPWHIEDDHPGCDGFAVVKDGTDEVEGCHMSRDMANQQMAALYANERSLPRGFPTQVASRVIDPSALAVRQRGVLVEARLSKVEIRMESDDIASIHGYATVYDYPYDVAGGPPYGFTETIGRGATKKSIHERDDVRLLLNHDGIPLARTKSGTMNLASDDVGLLVEVPALDLRSTTVRDAVLAMNRGDMDEMSFAFQVTRQTWSQDYTQRDIQEVKLFDVSLVTFPANPAASAYIKTGTASAGRGMSLSLARAQAEALSLR